MAVERIIGVDFGTSTSVIRVKRYQDGKPVGEKLDTKEVLFQGSGGLGPTVIMKDMENPSIAYYGSEALVKRKNMQQFHSFKVDLESENPEKRALARSLTEEYFRYLAKLYRNQSDSGHFGDVDDKEQTIISYPVKWSERTKQFMLETARKAGFANVTGRDEAQAAIQAVTVMSTEHLQKHGLLRQGIASNILLIDMGAGTTDLVLCRYTPGDQSKTEILNTWPKEGKILFGGREIDVLLKNFFWDKMDEADAEMVFKRIGTDKFKTWKETVVSPALAHDDTVSDFEPLDNCVDMMQIDMDEYCLNRAEFEKYLEDYLKQLPVLVNGCIQDTNLRGSDVDLVIVTGGHSQWYFVQEMLAGKMTQFGKVDLPKIKDDPSRIVPISRPQETVALGLVFDRLITKLEPDPPRPPDPPTSPEPPKTTPPKPPIEVEYAPESEFKLLSDGENYVIAAYTGNRKVVAIPPIIRGRKVAVIGSCAFIRSEVEKIIIPDTVTTIGSNAFSGCKMLHTVIAHEKIKIIDDYAFLQCEKLLHMDFGMGEVPVSTVKFPPVLKYLGINSFKKNPVKEVTLSRKTKWKHIYGNAFNTSNTAIFYYD